jgi:hypothetical protein
MVAEIRAAVNGRQSAGDKRGAPLSLSLLTMYTCWKVGQLFDLTISYQSDVCHRVRSKT